MAQRRFRPRRQNAIRRCLVIERLTDRCVLAAIAGEIFGDSNETLRREVDEAGLANRLVFADLNQNQVLDAAEPIALSDSNGQFRFEAIDAGEYSLEIFLGGARQSQTIPATADVGVIVVGESQAESILTRDQYWYSLSTGSADSGGSQDSDGAVVVSGDFLQSETSQVALDGTANRFHLLPDGRLLVLGASEGKAASWLLNPSDGTVTKQGLAVEESLIAWGQSSIDQNGQGILLGETVGESIVHLIDYSDAGEFSIVATDTSLATGSMVLASSSGPRSVLASQVGGDFAVSLWSDSLGQVIEGSTHQLSSVNRFFGFDDAAGILLARDASDSVVVFDVDSNFALLNQISNVSEPIAYDSVNGRLATISSDHDRLDLWDALGSAPFASFDVDLSDVGEIRDLIWKDSRSLLLLGADGLLEINLRNADSLTVTVEADGVIDDLSFGVVPLSDNQPPEVAAELSWTLQEDSVLVVSASELMSGVYDPDGDELIVLQQGHAMNGTVLIGFDGSLTYEPNQDFYGVDEVQFRVHDGASLSETVTVQFEVTPVADLPSGIQGMLADVSESISQGSIVGTFRVLDPDQISGVDSTKHHLVVDDSRFDVVGEQLVFVGGEISFETNTVIDLVITAFDPDAGGSVNETLQLRVQDPDGPQLRVYPDAIRVDENSEEVLLTLLTVQDSYNAGDHVLEVHDDRFRVEGNHLYLKAGANLDFETEPEIILVVTATRENDPSVSVRETLLVQVMDVPEQPQRLSLSGNHVSENILGAIVGTVLVDGGSPSSRFDLTVNDSRFEVVNGVLKLLDQIMVERDTQTEIEIEISVSDREQVFDVVSEVFVIEVTENANPHHNLENPYDVDRNGSVTALDALAIINYLNVYGPGPIRRTDDDYAYDVNADQLVTSLDVLLVLNEINRQRLRGEAVSEGEQVNSDETQADSPTIASPTDSPQSGAEISGNQDSVRSPSADDSELGDSRWSLSAVAEGEFTAGTVSWDSPAVDLTIEQFANDLLQSGAIENDHSVSLSDLEEQQVDRAIDLLGDD